MADDPKKPIPLSELITELLKHSAAPKTSPATGNNALADAIKAISERKEPPELLRSNIAEALKQITEESAKSDPTKEPAIQFIMAAVKAEGQKKAAETGEVDGDLTNAWLKDHWSLDRRICPICGTNDWGLIPQFVHMSLGPLGPRLRPRTLPCVGLACRNCGHTLFFNALKMGLLAEGPE
jgi:hypothetical protein